jgi:hypothetical protein
MIEYNLDDIPDAVRVYPASAATATFPQTPANNWTMTVLFCGGNDLKSNQWTTDWASERKCIGDRSFMCD